MITAEIKVNGHLISHLYVVNVTEEILYVQMKADKLPLKEEYDYSYHIVESGKTIRGKFFKEEDMVASKFIAAILRKVNEDL